MTRRPKADWRSHLETTEKYGYVFGIKVTFLAVLATVVVIGFMASNPFVAVVAALFAGAMLKSIVPYDEFRDWCDSVWQGEVSVELRSRIRSGYDAVKGVFSR